MRLVILQNGVVAPFSQVDGECVVELTDIYLETAELNVDDDLLLTMNDATTHLVPLSSVYMRDFRLPVVLVTLTADVATMQINEVSTIGAGSVNFTVPNASLFEEGEIIIIRRNGPNDLILDTVAFTTINGVVSMTIAEDYRTVWFTKRGNDWTAIADFDEAGGVGGDSIFTLEANEALWGANTASIPGDPRGEFAVDVQGHRTNPSQVAAGDGSIAIGNRTTAGGNQSIAIGQEAEANGLGKNIAIGVLASADVNSIAIGDSATVNAPATGGGIAIGNYSNVAGIDSLAIGRTAIVADGERNISIGYTSNSDGQDAIAMGSYAVTTSDNTIALGRGASIAGTADRSIAIGFSASVNNAITDAIAIGPNTEVRQIGSVVIGANAYSGENNIATESHVVIGQNASVPPNSPGGIAIGDGANLVATLGVDSHGRIAIGEGASVSAGADGGIAIGDGAISAELDSIIIGNGAYNGSGAGVVAIGAGSSGAGNNSVIVGKSGNASSYGIGIGYLSSSSDNAVAIGRNSLAGSDSSISIGNAPVVQSANSISAGTSATVQSDSPYSIAIGTSAAVGQYSPSGIAIGGSAGVGSSSVGSIAIGMSTSSNGTQSIAIGYQSSTGTAYKSLSIGPYVSQGLNVQRGIAIGSDVGIGINSERATVIGPYTTSNHNDTVVIGPYVGSTANNQVSIGHSNAANAKIILDNGQLTVPALDVNGHITEQVTTVSTGSNYVINMAIGTVWAITLTGSITISFSNVVAGRSCTVNLIQGGGGSNTVSWTGVTWPGGVAPTLSTTAGRRDKIVFDSYNGSVIDGSLAGLHYS